MDSLIKIVEQKKRPVVATIHEKRIDLIRRYIREGKNVFICGPIGVGKSFILERVLEDTNHIETLSYFQVWVLQQWSWLLTTTSTTA